MIAQILSTGDEVMLGDIADTNSAYLCRQLKELGVPVTRITAVGDDVEGISRALEEIAASADICLVTGGLGPTQDDVTAMACARACNSPLALDKKAIESMNRYYGSRGWALPSENDKQAMLPENADFLENTQGTAPGFSVELNRGRFFFMPGVPHEMKAMFLSGVRPWIQSALGGKQAIDLERLMVFGLSESRVGSLFDEFSDLFPKITLGFRARFPLIEVKLMTGSGASLVDAKAWAIEKLGDHLISDQGRTLAQEVGALLSRKGQTLSVAESCTGGLISHLLTDVAGASDYFLLSATTYANSAKMDVLGVDLSTLEAHGAVHEQTALEMAKGARKAGHSDWAVSTTGIAGPTGGTAEKPVGTVCMGVAGPGLALAKRICLDTGQRQMNKQLFAAAALNLLRQELVRQG